MDLIDMQKLKASNRGYAYILTCIDLFSKFAWAAPLKSKTSTAVASAVKTIFQNERKSNFRLPKEVQTDNGSEFKGKVELLLKSNNVRVVRSQPHSPTSQAQVERFNGTLKRKIKTMMLVHDSLAWFSWLSSLTRNYNNSIHRVTKSTPAHLRSHASRAELTNAAGRICDQAKKLMAPALAAAPPLLHVGDTVRVSMAALGHRKKKLRKRFTNWSRKLFVVTRVEVPPQSQRELELPRYKLSDSQWYSPFDLMKVDPTTLKRTIRRKTPRLNETKGDLVLFQTAAKKRRTMHEKQKAYKRLGIDPAQVLHHTRVRRPKKRWPIER
jgi:hypothetical protein